MKTLTTHYIDGAFVESHGREVHGHHQADQRPGDRPRHARRRGRYAARHRRGQDAHSPVSASRRRKSARRFCAGCMRPPRRGKTI